MVLRMARPTKRKRSSFFQFRRRVPADVLSKAKGRQITFIFPAADEKDTIISVTIGSEVNFSLRTRDPSEAVQFQALALTQFEKHCEAIRHGPRPLTRKQRSAICGLIYRAFSYTLEDDPGDAEVWEQVKATNEAVLRGEDALSVLGIFPDKAAARKATLEHRFGPLVDLFLRREGVLTTEESRTALLEDVGKALTEVAEKLKRNADGDYRPDTNVEKFPVWEGAADTLKESQGSQGASRATAKSAPAFADIFEKWIIEVEPAHSTRTTWRAYWERLKNFVGHDRPGDVTQEQVYAWRDSMVAEGRSARNPLATAKALYNVAIRRKMLSANPVEGVPAGRKKARAGEKKKPYTDAEVAKLLALADKETLPSRYWLPWLLALSGARATEVGQLWGSMVVQEGGVWIMKIMPTPDGGQLKNASSEREVPIHPAVLERGFIEFVRAKGDGPLFYGNGRKPRRVLPSGTAAPAPKGTTKAHAAKSVGSHLGEWVRKQEGFNDPRKHPLHAFRHWFKTACIAAHIHPNMADALQGHAGRGEAAGYEHPTVAMKAEAIARIPVPEPLSHL